MRSAVTAAVAFLLTAPVASDIAAHQDATTSESSPYSPIYARVQQIAPNVEVWSMDHARKLLVQSQAAASPAPTPPQTPPATPKETPSPTPPSSTTTRTPATSVPSHTTTTPPPTTTVAPQTTTKSPTTTTSPTTTRTSTTTSSPTTKVPITTATSSTAPVATPAPTPASTPQGTPVTTSSVPTNSPVVSPAPTPVTTTVTTVSPPKTTPSTTPSPTTPSPTSPAPTSPAPTSPAPTSPAPTSPAPTTPGPTTVTTASPPSTTPSTTPSPTTPSPTSPAPTTPGPTTVTTASPPNTTPSTTPSPTTPSPTSPAPTTPLPTPTPTTSPSPATTPSTTATPPSDTPVPTSSPVPTSTPVTTPPTGAPTTTPSTDSPVPTSSPIPTSTPLSSTPVTTSSPTDPPTTPVTTAPSNVPGTTPSSTPSTATPDLTPSSTPTVSSPVTNSPTNTPAQTASLTPGPPTTSGPPATTPTPTDVQVVTPAPSNTLSQSSQEILNPNNRTTAPVTTLSVDTLLTTRPPEQRTTLPPDATQEPTAVPRPPVTSRGAPVTPNSPDSTEPISLTGSDTTGDQTNRYVFNAVVGVSLVFLAFFHYIAIDPSFVSPDTASASLAAANSWELSSFVVFMQSAAIVSYANVDAPHAVLVTYTDSFSWLNYLIRGSAPSSTRTTSLAALFLDGPSRFLASSDSEPSYKPFGIQQFALRIHVSETDLFVRAWTFFFILMACFLLLVVGASFLAQCVSRHHSVSTPSYSSDSSHYTNSLRQVSRRLLGFTIWALTMSVLPLSVVSIYETMQGVYATDGGLWSSTSGVFALVALVVIGLVIVGGAIAIHRQSEVDLSKYRTKITFGVLYVNCKYNYRTFFAVGLLVQFATGLLLAGVSDVKGQLLSLVGLHSAFALLMLVLRPFVETIQLVVSVALEVIVVVIFGLVYAMAQANGSKSNATKKHLGTAVVVLVCVVVGVMFVRGLFRLWAFITGFAKDDGQTSYVPALSSGDRTPLKNTEEDATISLGTQRPSGEEDYNAMSSPLQTIKIVESKRDNLDHS
ncbi:unnamed protein product [Aphanomyces euteiches]